MQSHNLDQAVDQQRVQQFVDVLKALAKDLRDVQVDGVISSQEEAPDLAKGIVDKLKEVGKFNFDEKIPSWGGRFICEC